MKYSLRIRLTLSCAIAIAVLLAGLGVTLYVSLRGAFVSRFDLSMRSRAVLLINSIDWDARQGIHLSEDSPHSAGLSGLDLPRYYQIWTRHGQPLLVAGALHGHQLRFDAHPSHGGSFLHVKFFKHRAAREYIFQIARKPDDDDQHGQHQHGRQDPGPSHHLAPARPTSDHRDVEPHHPDRDKLRHYIIAVAKSTGELDAALDSLGWSLIIACSAATLLSAAVMWHLLERGFRSVDKVADAITRVGTKDLSDRVAIADAPEELRPIIDRLNQLLQRVEDTVNREKALTADIAHELRTPLAGMRAATELAVSRPREAEEYRRIFRDVLASEMQMQQLVENLLVLARLEAHEARTYPLDECDCTAMIQCLLDERSAEIHQRHITTQIKLTNPAVIRAPKELLRIVLRNVIDNAVAYVNDGGTISISSHFNSQAFVLEIGNTGSKIPTRDANMVFERFWRGDHARTGSHRHSGLGLSIVRQAVENIGGIVSVRSEQGEWFELRFEYPASTSDGHSDRSKVQEDGESKNGRTSRQS